MALEHQSLGRAATSAPADESLPRWRAARQIDSGNGLPLGVPPALPNHAGQQTGATEHQGGSLRLPDAPSGASRPSALSPAAERER